MSHYNEKRKGRIISNIPLKFKKEIEKYLEEMHQKFPDKDEFKSASSFCYYTLKNAMEIYKHGRKLEDFVKKPDKNILDLFKDYRFMGFIPLYEKNIEWDKYKETKYEDFPELWRAIYRWWYKDIDKDNIFTLKNKADLLNNFLKSNNLTKEFSIDITTEKFKNNRDAIIEYVGKYENFHFINIKTLLAIIGIIGGEVIDLDFIGVYARIEVRLTDLYKDRKYAKKRRIELMKKNQKMLLNFYRIINEKSNTHLWIKISENPDIFPSFENEEKFNAWIDALVKDIEKYGDKENKLNSILKIFEKCHYIIIDDESDLKFKIKNFDKNNDFIINYLMKIGNIKRNGNGFYSIEKRNG